MQPSPDAVITLYGLPRITAYNSEQWPLKCNTNTQHYQNVITIYTQATYYGHLRPNCIDQIEKVPTPVKKQNKTGIAAYNEMIYLAS